MDRTTRSPLASLASPAVLVLLVASCGGVGRQVLVEPREDSTDLLAALDQVARERGLATRTREGRVVQVVVDPELGAAVRFSAGRRGVAGSVRVRDDLPPEQQRQALASAEQLAVELMDAARAAEVQIAQQRAIEEQQRALEEERRRAREAAERAERERREAAEHARQAQQRQQLADFMARNQARTRAHRATMGADPAPGPGPSTGAPAPSSASARCCVNGAYYECSSAAALDRCGGRFARCVSERGLSGAESCLRDAPPDPSGCRRAPDRDGEC